MPTRMNINSVLRNTAPAMSAAGFEGSAAARTSNAMLASATRDKKEAEVIAASALASLVTNVVVDPHWYLYHQQSLRQQQLSSPQQQEQHQKRQGANRNLEIPERLTKNGRRRAVPFPLKLMQVLSDEQYSNIISWMPNGRSFVIIRPRSFVKEILPKDFKSAQYASFTRKLMRWGFSKCEDGTGEFSHPQFRKGRVDLIEKISCKRVFSAKQEASTSTTTIKSSSKTTANGDSQSAASDDQSTASTNTKKSEEDQEQEAAEVDNHPRHIAMMASKNPAAMMMSSLAKEYHLNLEFEKMKLRRCIHDAALSRKALAEMQRNNFASTTSNTIRGGSTRAFALAAGGFPKLPGAPTLGPHSALLHHPWHSMMFSPTASTSRLFPPFQDFDFTHHGGPSSLLGRPNIRGAKTA
jgi:hypothetical protein